VTRAAADLAMWCQFLSKYSGRPVVSGGLE
jgi:hypothetical protein